MIVEMLDKLIQLQRIIKEKLPVLKIHNKYVKLLMNVKINVIQEVYVLEERLDKF